MRKDIRDKQDQQKRLLQKKHIIRIYNILHKHVIIFANERFYAAHEALCEVGVDAQECQVWRATGHG